ncbi:hypothetical protein ABZT34_32050 [Streptomyces sp. NPDC005329]|uniref:hypothetical protein n=1 Tax=Streptomyces sp. NPDC005329 TaxID=3157034 RepID=UPI0033AED1B6
MIRVPSAPAATATLSTGSVITLLAGGGVPPDSPLVWPLVVLALGSMAYDLGVRASRRRGQ